ncbi:MAG: glycosyltransferase [Gammaproteobacteria bacterium]|nr:glycosyltransferase [Gammaproteobacteria bacterium]
MHILMITDVYFPRINGVSTSIKTYRTALREMGHKVTVIAPDYGNTTDDEEGTIRIPSRGLLVDKEDRMMKARHIYRMMKQLKGMEIDIIHIQTPFVAHYAGLKLSRILGVPKVESYHTFFEEYLYHYVPFLPKGLMKSVARRFSKSQCNSVDAIVVPSTAMLEALRGYGVASTAEIIPTGLDLRRFKGGDGAAFREKYGIEKDRPVLLNVGRVAHEKNIDFLIHVLREVKEAIPDILLVIVGEGPAEKHLHALVQELGLQGNVRFIGYLDRDTELKDCYCAGDMFVFASRTETQGLVLLEAMALGVPVISTAVMGTRDIIEPQRGAIHAREELIDFTNKIVTTINDKNLLESLSTQAQQFASGWSEQRYTQKMIDLYSGVIVEHEAHCAANMVTAKS